MPRAAGQGWRGHAGRRSSGRSAPRYRRRVAGPDDETYTVGDLNRLIRQTLARRFPDEIWVEGEMRGLKRHAASGHVYFELADPSADGRQADAVMQVALYRTDKEAVNRLLRRTGSVRMADGVHIRIRGTLDYYPPQGKLQLRMRWIDPEHTLGRLEAERRRLVTALTDEDLLERNRRLPYPLLPLRVGLVTSHGSAAQEDFLHELGASGLAWRVTCVASSVQGPGAESELVAGLHTLARLDVDVIALIRGGGARTDLAAFDGELLARAIASLRVPVLTGIGHETDRAVADLVAARPAKTPTACAAGLVRDATLAHDRARRAWSAIAERARADLDHGHANLDRVAHRVTGAGRRQLDRHAATLGHATTRTGRSARLIPVAATDEIDRLGGFVALGARRRLDQATTSSREHRRRLVTEAPRALRRGEAALAARSARVDAADPARLLARGWSITRTADGRAVAGAAAVHPGQELVTTFADGSVHSTVDATDLTPGSTDLRPDGTGAEPPSTDSDPNTEDAT